MRRPRLQFRLSTLLWITLAVACWFGGMRFERWMAERKEPPVYFPKDFRPYHGGPLPDSAAY